MGRLGIALICLALWHTPQWRRDADRPDVAAIALAEVGVREASGKNDGARVEEYLRYVNLRAGQPWCAAFVCWAYGKAGVENPRSGWCPSLFPLRRVVWQKGLLRPAGPVPCRGDVFGLWFESRGRIAHVGLVDHWGDKYVTTIEGNTNEAGSREGDGVYRKRRLCASIYQVARWPNAL